MGIASQKEKEMKQFSGMRSLWNAFGKLEGGEKKTERAESEDGVGWLFLKTKMGRCVCGGGGWRGNSVSTRHH